MRAFVAKNAMYMYMYSRKPADQRFSPSNPFKAIVEKNANYAPHSRATRTLRWKLFVRESSYRNALKCYSSDCEDSSMSRFIPVSLGNMQEIHLKLLLIIKIPYITPANNCRLLTFLLIINNESMDLHSRVWSIPFVNT